MTEVTHTEESRLDILSIWLFIAADNPKAADKMLDIIDEKCILLGDNPHLGQARPDIAPDLRHFPVKNYLILYRELPSGIEIVRIPRGSRDLTELFHHRRMLFTANSVVS